MATKTYTKGALTGGTSDALDSIDGDDLADGYRAIVITDDYKYNYYLDAGSGATEDGIRVIAPDINAGSKRWLLKDPFNENETLSKYDNSLVTAVATIGAVETTLIINTIPEALTDNLTIPNTLSLIWLQGCLLEGAYTLTINSSLQAGTYQLFESDLTVVANLKLAKVEWFGDCTNCQNSGWSDDTIATNTKDISNRTDIDDELNFGQKSVKVWKNPYGIKDAAVAASFSLAGDTEPTTQVAGYASHAAIADYANRDSVTVFTQNISQPALVSTTSTIYTSTTVVSVDFSGKDIKSGMIAEIFSPVPIAGVITDFSGTTVTVSTWYKVGDTGTQTPTDTDEVFINRFTKIWGQNTNIELPTDGGANAGTGFELGLIPTKTGTGAGTVGFDVIKLSGEAPQAAYKARGGCLSNYVSQDALVIGYESVDDAIGFQTEDPIGAAFVAVISGTSKFRVDETGKITGSYLATQVVITTATLNINSVVSLVTGTSAVITLPSATGATGKILIIKNTTVGDITVHGSTVSTGNSVMYISDGSNWIQLKFN